jgi:signal transduction histidine kinase
MGIEKKDHRVCCWLEDDGKGFDVLQVKADTSSRKGLGLITMEERARMLRGILDIRSSAGGGTRICLTVPLYERGVS